MEHGGFPFSFCISYVAESPPGLFTVYHMWRLPFKGTRIGLPVHAHVRMRFFDTSAGARLGEASHLVSGPAQGRDVEHSGALKGRG